ncbi:MAG: IclR family transcriptional regulator [Actinobacteria bacterium]|nr:IclR family transcriptional regulator [Actinomycetota bacterium]
MCVHTNNISEGQTVTAIERAADVLTLFANSDSPTLGVTEIAHHLELSKAVVHRILTSLRHKAYVDLDEKTRRYSLGPAALNLGLSHMQRLDVRTVARPFMQSLSDATGETATLSIHSGAHRTYVDQITPPREVKMTVQLGRPFPLHAGASSRAFLASDDEREAYLDHGNLERLTEHTITDQERLRELMRQIRAQGYATSSGERQPGASSVAAPVFDHEGRPVAVMSVCGPAERFAGEVEAATTLLLAATTSVSEELGYRPSRAEGGTNVHI